MKKLRILLILCFISAVSCKQEKKEADSSELESTEKEELAVLKKTYAEISVKEGGKWVENKYEGGNFKNIRTLTVPSTHTDHSYFIRYEGPGWESNKVGYRLYLDWRNAIDIFGKLTDTLVLSQVGQDGFDSYHELSDWGMDILKAGKSLGIGSIGRYVDNNVSHFNEVDSTVVSVNNSEAKSSVNINYYGWKTGTEKIDLSSVLSIAPDTRYTHHTVQPSDSITGICTGIVKFENIELINNESENSAWGYIATYGEQTLVPDDLGMAIFYKKDEVSNKVDSEFDHLLVFKPTTKEITYYFLGAWEQEKNGIKTKEEFVSYLDKLLSELNSNNKI